MKRLSLLAISIILLTACKKDDDPTPTPTVNKPTPLKVDETLTNSTWKIQYYNTYMNTNITDTVKFVSNTQAIFVSNNNSTESLEYISNDSAFYLSKHANSNVYYYQYKYVNKVNNNTYTFTSGPESMGDGSQSYSSIGHWNATFTKIN